MNIGACLYKIIYLVYYMILFLFSTMLEICMFDSLLFYSLSFIRLNL